MQRRRQDRLDMEISMKAFCFAHRSKLDTLPCSLNVHFAIFADPTQAGFSTSHKAQVSIPARDTRGLRRTRAGKNKKTLLAGRENNQFALKRQKQIQSRNGGKNKKLRPRVTFDLAYIAQHKTLKRAGRPVKLA